MSPQKHESPKPAEPAKTKGTPKDETVELQVEQLEERIAPLKAF